MRLLVTAFCVLPSLALGSFGILPDGRLDMKTLEAAYAESEFEKVHEVLEGYVRQKGSKASQEERIFAFKYLGVIYAADSVTLPRAESYFNRLLALAPNIELVDMFVSPKIQSVFQRVKEENKAQAAYKSQYDAFGKPLSSPKPADSKAPPPQVAAPKEKPSTEKVSTADKRRKWMWWAAGLFTVGAGVGVYLWSREEEAPGRIRNANGGLGG